jgi:hypothetical protein
MSSSTPRSRSDSLATEPPTGVTSLATTCGSSAEPLGDALGGGEELADFEHSILEEVPEPAAGDEGDSAGGLDVLAEHEHADLGMEFLDRSRRAGALVGERGWHADVDDREIGLLVRDPREDLLGVANGGDDVVPAILEGASKSLEDFDLREPFDAVIGNVPFAKVTPYDPRYNRGRHSLHNYFLVKSLSLVRPGGVLVALTSRYTLDARNPAVRRELGDLGDLVGALRLPSGAMRAVAGTEAVMDLLVLCRREPDAPVAGGADRWDTVTAVPVPNESVGGPDETPVEMNRYFAEHAERVLGTTVAGRGMCGDGELMVRGDMATPNGTLGARVAAGLAELVDESPLRYLPPAPAPAAGRPPARRAPRLGEVELAGERLVPLREDGFVVAKTGTIYRHVDGTSPRRRCPSPRGTRSGPWSGCGTPR